MATDTTRLAVLGIIGVGVVFAMRQIGARTSDAGTSPDASTTPVDVGALVNSLTAGPGVGSTPGASDVIGPDPGTTIDPNFVGPPSPPGTPAAPPATGSTISPPIVPTADAQVINTFDPNAPTADPTPSPASVTPSAPPIVVLDSVTGQVIDFNTLDPSTGLPLDYGLGVGF